MRRRLAALFTSVLLLCALTACQDNSLVMDYVEKDVKRAPETMTDLEILEQVDNDTPYTELLTLEHDIHDFVQKYDLEWAVSSYTLKDVAVDMGIECLRMSPEGALYSVHKITQGGLLYIFYDNFPEHYEENPGRYDYRPILHWCYVQKDLSQADFSDIKEGSTFDAVKRIDPTTQIFRNLYNYNPRFYETSGGFGSWHYLRDGYLKIVYKNENGKWVVFVTEFYPDYQMMDEQTERGGKNFPYEGKILDKDRI